MLKCSNNLQLILIFELQMTYNIITLIETLGEKNLIFQLNIQL